MTETYIQCLKDNIDNVVEIQTVNGECLTARIQIVTDDYENHVHDVMYEVISSNQIDSYSHLERLNGYLLDFVEIVSVKPIPQPQVVSLTPE